jgi:secreted PhoX family phosphatase
MKNSSNIGSAAISRRALLAGAVAAGSAPLLLATSASSATTKVSQAAVHFRIAANTDHNCGACRHFMAPSSCRFVEGTISSDCSCWIWTSKLG